MPKENVHITSHSDGSIEERDKSKPGFSFKNNLMVENVVNTLKSHSKPSKLQIFFYLFREGTLVLYVGA